LSHTGLYTTHTKNHIDYERLLDLSLDLFCIIGDDGHFKLLSGDWEKALGFTSKELIDQPYIGFLHPDDWETARKQMQRAMTGESLSSFENRFLCKDGSHKWLLWRAKADPVNRQLYAVASDATNKKMTEEALAIRDREILTSHRLWEIFHSQRPLGQLYNDIVEEISAATGFPIAIIAIFDEEHQKIIFQGSKGIPVQFGMTSPEFPIEGTFSGVVVRTGKPLIVTRANERSEYTSEILKRVGGQTFIGFPMRVGEKVVGSLGLSHPDSIEVTDRMARWIESLANYVAALTQRKRAEEELRLSHEQLRELSTHLRTAVEEERKRIAREIHDELGQELSLLRLELGLIEGRLRKDQKDLRKGTKSMAKLIISSIQTVRRISSDLRPTLLDSLGLGAAVEWQVKEFQKRTKTRCNLSIEPAEVIANQDQSTALFRILQETLTNVARHSKATKVKVKLQASEENIVLTVQDNGVGIAPERIADAKSFGLIGIRERVLQLGGSVSIGGTTKKGTLVSVTVPRES
jgi:PAS domain S-box-containing protein